MEDKFYNLELNLNEINLIIQSLSTQPYVNVFGLIEKIKKDVEKQIENEKK